MQLHRRGTSTLACLVSSSSGLWTAASTTCALCHSSAWQKVGAGFAAGALADLMISNASKMVLH